MQPKSSLVFLKKKKILNDNMEKQMCVFISKLCGARFLFFLLDREVEKLIPLSLAIFLWLML